tara:strand:+ start:7969 stop:8595 length:627 start_codon:yes stop_codon:yes gene_type:complete
MNRVLQMTQPDSLDQTNYYYFEQGFSEEELKKIEKDVIKLPLHTASTFGGENDGRTRVSRVKWVPQNTQWWWLYEKLNHMAIEANSNLWNFSLHTMPEQIQYTEYVGSKGGKYEWHQDIGPSHGSQRKISITVQLSEADDYEGGDLELFKGGPFPEDAKDSNHSHIIKAPRKRGCVFIFPSFMMHRVAPVLSGTRKSFVLWLGGGHYI